MGLTMPSLTSAKLNVRAPGRPTTYVPTQTSEWLPLTTVFTPPASCTQKTFSMLDPQSAAFIDWGAWDTQCWPESFKSLQHWQTDMWYSPGVCPASYTIASQSLASYNSAVRTLAYCCPPGNFEISSWTYPGTTILCASYVTTPWEVVIGSNRHKYTTSNLHAIQWAVSVQWAAGDLDKFSPIGAPTMIRPTTIGSTTSKHSSLIGTSTDGAHTGPVQSPSRSGTSKSNDNSSWLTTGTEAGIAAGAGAVILAISIFLIWFIMHRRKRSQASANAPAIPLNGMRTSYSPILSSATPKEMAGWHVHEMPERKGPGELNIFNERYEVYGWDPRSSRIAARELDGHSVHNF